MANDLQAIEMEIQKRGLNQNPSQPQAPDAAALPIANQPRTFQDIIDQSSPEKLYPNGNRELSTSTLGATIRGFEKAFEPPSDIFGVKTGVPENLTENIEGTLLFPIIRGAEITAKMFGKVDPSQPFTTMRQIVDDRINLTETLRQQNPGTIEGIQLGLAVESLPKLAETVTKGLQGLGKMAPQISTAFKEWKAGKALARSQRLGKRLLALDGDPLDAMVNRPEEVLSLIQKDAASVDDLAQETGLRIQEIESGLGKRVGQFRKNFISDPTKKVNLTEPVVFSDGTQMPPLQQIVTDFEKSMTLDNGSSALNSKQQNQLEFIKKAIFPEAKKITNNVDLVTNTKTVPVNDLSSKDALLVLDKIDEMTSMKEIQNGNISSSAVNNLLEFRRALKSQIRGSNMEWAKEDEIFSNFKTDAGVGLSDRFLKDTRESFVDNLYGKNKTPIRDRIAKVLDYGEYLDTKGEGLGSEAFFRRLSNVKAAQRVQEVGLQIKDIDADKLNRIVNFWASSGRDVGAGLAAGPTFLIGNLLGGGGATGTAIGGSAGLAALYGGRAAGRAAGMYVGLKMADPMRALNAALKAKELSKDAKNLAQDLSYIHSKFGNEGIISFMDIIGPIPAVNELADYTNSIPTKSVNQKKSQTVNIQDNNGLLSLGAK